MVAPWFVAFVLERAIELEPVIELEQWVFVVGVSARWIDPEFVIARRPS